MAKRKTVRKGTRARGDETRPVTTHHERDSRSSKRTSRVDPGAAGNADRLGARDADRRAMPVEERVVSENVTDSTKAHGLASPNPRLRPGHTSTVTGHEGERAAQPRLRPGRTSFAQPLPPANPHPRAAASSRAPDMAGGRLETSFDRDVRMAEDRRRRFAGGPKVMATQLGYYDHIRRRPGDVFRISNRKVREEDMELRVDGRDEADLPEGLEYQDFSERWMEVVPDNTPERVTLGNEALKQEHDRILHSRALERGHAGSDAQVAQQGIQVGRDDVDDDIEDTGGNPLDDVRPRRVTERSARHK
jgi:hypothetical protein